MSDHRPGLGSDQTVKTELTSAHLGGMVSNVMDTDTPVGALLFWAMTALTCI